VFIPLRGDEWRVFVFVLAFCLCNCFLPSTTIWKQGSTARLQCTVKGSPELHSTWFLNNSELSTGGRHAVGLKDGVATLEIHDVLLTDSGNYTCEVLNECGCESCSIKVTVKGVSKPPSFRKELLSTEAVRGSVAVLECEIAGSAPLEVSWKKNKKRLSSDKKYSIVSQGSLASLEIQSFESADTGEYECVVSNEVGSATSKSVLKQKEPARILEKAASISVTAGDSATLECTVSGSPELKVKWFKDGKEMIGGRKYKIAVKENTAILKILAADKGDTSEYKMEVSNKVGKDECTCSVTVIGRF
uniref:Ig-like domain-containing protein n=1 Tax=Astatotilapia calliptera TaxID=8154 RepID=A0AAX7UY94_ASTCA